MARQQYWVSPSEGAWIVARERRALERHPNKERAVDAGVRIARANQPSELLIQHRLGRIEDRRTYGHDPYPPRG